MMLLSERAFVHRHYGSSELILPHRKDSERASGTFFYDAIVAMNPDERVSFQNGNVC